MTLAESPYEPPNRRDDLDLPDDTTPSIAQYRVHNPQSTIAPFGANSWPLAAISGADRRGHTIIFDDWPVGFRGFARHVAYVLINHGNPESLLEEHDNLRTLVHWPSSGTIYNVLYRLRKQVTWLTGDWSQRHYSTPVEQPSDLDARHLDDLREWIEQRETNAADKSSFLSDIIRVWHLNPWLPENMQWPEPAWRHNDWQPRRRREENKTLPICEATFAPMLEWAVAFVTSFSTDILDARSHYLKRTRLSIDSEAEAKECLRQYVSDGRSLPAKLTKGKQRRVRIAWQVLEYRHGISAKCFPSQYRWGFKALLDVTQEASEFALDFPIVGEFHSQKWIPFISVPDVGLATQRDAVGDRGPLMSHLRTACLIVITALTGMRPEEVLDLHAGCAHDPILRPGGSRLHLIHGRVFKGNVSQENGSPRKPRPAAWATVPVAVQAVHVMERIQQAEGDGNVLLFSDGKSLPVHPRTAIEWLESFQRFVNSRLVPHSASPGAFTIQQDPDGAVTLRRFRRTLAWFLRCRPNGSVTTAVQYQHVGVAVGEGYAGTKASGMPDLLLEEDWAQRAATIRHLDLLLREGKGVGGPAAGRAVEASQRLPRNLSPGDERRLRKDKSFRVYENNAAVALCVYDETKALCQKLKESGKDTRPDLLGCVDTCSNSARTDEHLTEMARQADKLRAEAEIAPMPMAQSMLALADRNDRIVDSCSASRVTLPAASRAVVHDPSAGTYGEVR